MNIITGLSPTKIAKDLAKLLTNASTVGTRPFPARSKGLGLATQD